MEKNKIIVIDFSIFMFRAIFSWRRNREIPPTYTCLNMILSCLRKIGVEPQDEIYIACDYGKSWRKSILNEYKGDRQEQRDKYSDIPWDDMFASFNQLIEDLNAGTNWRVVREWTMEADDFMGIVPKVFPDKNVILVTYDKDVEQLCYYDNVRIFSPLKKYKSKKGCYKYVKDPLKVLAGKIAKETSDNLKSEITNQEEYEKRKMCVSLLELPKNIEERIVELYHQAEQPKTNIDPERIPFPTSLKPRLLNLYNDKKDVISYEECLSYTPRKKKTEV